MARFASDDRISVRKCKRELHRCFYLHLGVATNTHPFALQCLFRYAAVDILSRPEDEAAVLFGECLREMPEERFGKPGVLNRTGVFVDATALMAVWPQEFDNIRVLICKLDSTSCLEHFTLFQPNTSGNTQSSHSSAQMSYRDWKGNDVMLANQYGHFTLLTPSKDMGDQPITRLLEVAELAAAEHRTTEPLLYQVDIAGKPAHARYSLLKLCELIKQQQETTCN